MEGRRVMLLMRVLCVAFVLLSVVLAMRKDSTIVSLMSVSWGTISGCFLAPYLYGLYWKRTTKAACMVNFAFSTAVMLANIFMPSSFPAILQSPINAGAFCMLAGLVLVPVVSLLTRPPQPQHVREVFACYDRTVVVTVKDSIGDQT